MRILHYFLGLPPYRSGGLTKYATDLMISQYDNDNRVSLLYPGDFTFWQKPRIGIKRNSTYKGISVYEIRNPSPVPLLHGVKTPEHIYNPTYILSEDALDAFYDAVRPEVFHVHTLMGLPLELLLYLKRKAVKVVFTSHDYYGLCPKVNFINYNGMFCNSSSGSECSICNADAPGSLFLKLRNSKYILKYKSQLSSVSAKQTNEKKAVYIQEVENAAQCEKYDVLLSHYRELFAQIDCFHFNSQVTKSVYDNFLSPANAYVIPITHGGIKDCRAIKAIDSNCIHLAMIGSQASYKGFPLLKNVLCQLDASGIRNWKLHVWGSETGVDSECDSIIYEGKYAHDSIKAVFESIDLLIVPSICKETFSFITLEALSYGVPVLVMSNVGAKDIVCEYAPDFIIEPSRDALYTKLTEVLANPAVLQEYSKNINSKPFNYDLESHMQKIQEVYLSILKS